MTSVSPEVKEKLEQYLALLRKWQKSINLVSNNTIDDAWERHFEDSLQLLEYLPQDGDLTLFDIGSGAGFPGLVLAMTRPDLSVTLIESDTKKCTFLSTVSRETKTPVFVVNQRIENVSRETVPAVITARALAPLDKLFDYCLPWINENSDLQMLFLKGGQVAAEIESAQQRYRFRYESFPSRTGDGVILKIADVQSVL